MNLFTTSVLNGFPTRTQHCLNDFILTCVIYCSNFIICSTPQDGTHVSTLVVVLVLTFVQVVGVVSKEKGNHWGGKKGGGEIRGGRGVHGSLDEKQNFLIKRKNFL